MRDCKKMPPTDAVVLAQKTAHKNEAQCHQDVGL
jgi:hypothetical protein